MSNITKKGSELSLPMTRDFFNVGSFFDDKWLSRFENNFPAVNISEDEKEYNIELVVPGFKKEDIKIKVDDDMLTISAESKTESEEKDKKENLKKEKASQNKKKEKEVRENLAKYELEEIQRRDYFV